MGPKRGFCLVGGALPLPERRNYPPCRISVGIGAENGGFKRLIGVDDIEGEEGSGFRIPLIPSLEKANHHSVPRTVVGCVHGTEALVGTVGPQKRR